MNESRDTGKKLVFASFCLSICGILAAVIATGSIHYYYLSSSNSMLDLLGNLGEASHIVKLQFNVMQETLAVQQVPLLVNGKIFIFFIIRD